MLHNKCYTAVSISTQVWGLVEVLEISSLKTAVAGRRHFLPENQPFEGKTWVSPDVWGLNPKRMRSANANVRCVSIGYLRLMTSMTERSGL